MSLILDISPFRQQSAMSCWWACFRMMRRYAGLEAPLHPRLFHRAFAENPSRIPTSYIYTTVVQTRQGPQRVTQYSPEVSFEYSESLSEESLATGRYRPVTNPRDWFEMGVGTDPDSLRVMRELLGVESFANRPPLRQWQLNDFRTRLLEVGPFMFISNWNAAGQHVVLVTGFMDDELGQRVVFVDPAYGHERELTVEGFNNLMPQLAMIPENPMFLRQAIGVNRYRLNTP